MAEATRQSREEVADLAAAKLRADGHAAEADGHAVIGDGQRVEAVDGELSARVLAALGTAADWPTLRARHDLEIATLERRQCDELAVIAERHGQERAPVERRHALEEAALLERVLGQHGWVQHAAARALGIGDSSLQCILRRHPELEARRRRERGPGG